jgi:hypothetical protein
MCASGRGLRSTQSAAVPFVAADVAPSWPLSPTSSRIRSGTTRSRRSIRWPLRRRPPRSAAPGHRDPGYRGRVHPAGSTTRARCRSTPSCSRVTCSPSRSSCSRPRHGRGDRDGYPPPMAKKVVIDGADERRAQQVRGLAHPLAQRLRVHPKPSRDRLHRHPLDVTVVAGLTGEPHRPGLGVSVVPARHRAAILPNKGRIKPGTVQLQI